MQHYRTRTFALSALLTSLLSLNAGCSDADSPTGPGSGQPTHAVTEVAQGLELTVGTNKATYGFGETVRVTASLTNVSGGDVHVDFMRGSPARFYNINTAFVDGDDVMHKSFGNGEHDTVTMTPGQVFRYTFEWDQTSRFDRQPVDRGYFEVSAVVNFDDSPALRVEGLFIELD